MRRPMGFVSALLLAMTVGSFASAANAVSDMSSRRILVLPLRSLGLSDTTVLVSGDLLVGSLEDLGMIVVRQDPSQPPLPAGAAACEAPGCAAELAREHGTELVVYGSLSRLGGKIIARLNVLRSGEPVPYYRDQLTAASEDDLDTVMRRFAEGIATGRPNSDRATVESVTQAESNTPARRATRAGMGIRAGFLFPTGDGFGGVQRMTSLRLAHRYEFRDFQIETTPVLGLAWGKGNLDWSMVDIGASRIFGTGDISSYLGASFGVHSVTVERRHTVVSSYPGSPDYTYEVGDSQTETVPTVDLVAGIMALRTYDFVAVIELRFHYVFETFERTGGGGAQGLMLTFGTSR